MSPDPLFVVVRRLLTAVSSLVAEPRLYVRGLQQLQHTRSVVVAHGLSHAAARGIFPDQGSSSFLLHWQVDSLPPRHQGSPLFQSFQEEKLSGCKSCRCPADLRHLLLFEGAVAEVGE